MHAALSFTAFVLAAFRVLPVVEDVPENEILNFSGGD